MFFLAYWYGRLRHPRKYRQHMQYVRFLNHHLDHVKENDQ